MGSKTARRTIAFLTIVLVLAIAIFAGPYQGNPNLERATGAVSGTLTSMKVDAAPTLDGRGTDAAWAAATTITITVTGGSNMPSPVDVSFKSVYVGGKVYFYTRWPDAQDSKDRFPWVWNSTSASWVQLNIKNDGDANTNYEDKLAMFWNISTNRFNTEGAIITCHSVTGTQGKHWTASAGELLDMWHWKRVRTEPIGQVDDQYMDNTQYNAATAKEAGRKSDPKTSGGYSDNVKLNATGGKLVNYTDDPSRSSTFPRYWVPNAGPTVDNGYYWLLGSSIDAGQAKEFVEFYTNGSLKDSAGNWLVPTAATHLPGIIVRPIVGDRGNISAAARWEGGYWDLEVARNLTTGSDKDVQFDDLSDSYHFTLAIFNNAQIDHGYHGGVYELKFSQPPAGISAELVTAIAAGVAVVIVAVAVWLLVVRRKRVPPKEEAPPPTS